MIPFKEILCTIAFTFPAIADGATCFASYRSTEVPKGTQIIHLPQIHGSALHKLLGESLPRHMIGPVAKSQFNIYRALLEKPNAFIFLEGIDIGPAEGYRFDFFKENSPEDTTTIQMAFKKGVPENFSDLTRTQKEVLSQFSGAIIALILGKVSQIHGVDAHGRGFIYKLLADTLSMTQLRQQGNDVSQLEADINHRKYDLREQDALFAIKDFLVNFPPNDRPTEVLLIFGGGHHFQKYFRDQPQQLQRFDLEFELLNMMVNDPFNIAK